MRTRDKKGQGATEYLLMLAAVLVIVAAAIYYVTRGAGAPTFSGHLELSDNNVNLVVDSGSIVAADWEYKCWEEGTSTPGSWTAGPATITEGAEIQVGTGASTGETWNLLVKHKPSRHVYPKITGTMG